MTPISLFGGLKVLKLREIRACLERLRVGSILTDEPLAKHTTWKIGGPADLFVVPDSPSGLSQTLQVAAVFSLPVVVMGAGSNLLFDDTGVRGIVVRIDKGLSWVTIKENRIQAGAGVWVPCLARAAARAGISGLEHIVGIPGTFGGLLFMNGGSQRRNIGESVRFVRVMDRQGRQMEMSRQECGFSYRHSVFQERELIILEAELIGDSGKSAEIRSEMLTILRSRRGKFPRKKPNCGSVFISDPAIYDTVGPPGKIIEDSGLKGLAVGDVEVSGQHANFIVNRGKATAEEVKSLVQKIRRKVHQQTGYWLRCEVRYVGPDGRITPLHRIL